MSHCNFGMWVNTEKKIKEISNSNPDRILNLVYAQFVDGKIRFTVDRVAAKDAIEYNAAAVISFGLLFWRFY